jgi:hypothetical protein
MIYTVGATKNSFLPMGDFRVKFLVDKKHKGDNIDHLNPYYCELTGLYYMWKHDKDDIVGLEHYRRYFYAGSRMLSREDAEEKLSHSDIMLIPHHHPRKRTTYEWFITAQKQPDFDKWLLCVDAACPEIMPVFMDYLNSNLLYICNMFVTRKEILDEWCSWIFPMLSLYDRAAGLTEFNRRIDGYLAEHTLGAWCLWKKLKIAEGNMHMV